MLGVQYHSHVCLLNMPVNVVVVVIDLLISCREQMSAILKMLHFSFEIYADVLSVAPQGLSCNHQNI